MAPPPGSHVRQSSPQTSIASSYSGEVGVLLFPLIESGCQYILPLRSIQFIDLFSFLDFVSVSISLINSKQFGIISVHFMYLHHFAFVLNNSDFLFVHFAVFRFFWRILNIWIHSLSFILFRFVYLDSTDRIWCILVHLVHFRLTSSLWVISLRIINFD